MRHHTLLRTLTILGGVLGLTSGATNGVMVLFSLEILDLDERGFGLLLAGLTVGSVVGTVNAAPLARRLGRGPALLAGYAAGAVGYAGFGLSSHPVIAGLFFAVAGWAVMVGNVLTMSIRQTSSRSISSGACREPGARSFGAPCRPARSGAVRSRGSPGFARPSWSSRPHLSLCSSPPGHC